MAEGNAGMRHYAPNAKIIGFTVVTRASPCEECGVLQIEAQFNYEDGIVGKFPFFTGDEAPWDKTVYKPNLFERIWGITLEKKIIIVRQQVVAAANKYISYTAKQAKLVATMPDESFRTGGIP